MSANSGRTKRSRNAWWPTRVGSWGWMSRTYGSNQRWKWSAKASAPAGARHPWAKASTQACAALAPGAAGVGVTERIAWPPLGVASRWDGRVGRRGSAQQDEDGGGDQPAEGGAGGGLGRGVVAESDARPGHQGDGGKGQDDQRTE